MAFSICVVLNSNFLVAVAVAVAAVASFHENARECGFTSTLIEPSITLVHSSNKAAVKASAYLETVGEKSRNYLPLNIKGFKFKPLSPVHDYYLLTIEADCAKLFFMLTKSNLDWNIGRVDATLHVPIQGIDICRLDDVHIAQSHGSHYKCESHTPYVCKPKSGAGVTAVIRVVLPYFEFEVFGSPENTMANQFTTGRTSCST